MCCSAALIIFALVVHHVAAQDSGNFYIQFNPLGNGFGKDARVVLLDALSSFEDTFINTWQTNIEAAGGSLSYGRFSFDVPSNPVCIVGCSEVQPPLPDQFPVDTEGQTWVQGVEWSFTRLNVDGVEIDAEAWNAQAFANNAFTTFLQVADSTEMYFSTVTSTEYLSSSFEPDFTLVAEEIVGRQEILLALRPMNRRFNRGPARALTGSLRTFFSEKIGPYMTETVAVEGIHLYGTRDPKFEFEASLVGRIVGQYVEGRIGPPRLTTVVTPFNYTYVRHYWQQNGISSDNLQDFYDQSIAAVRDSFDVEDFVPYLPDPDDTPEFENVTRAFIETNPPADITEEPTSTPYPELEPTRTPSFSPSFSTPPPTIPPVADSPTAFPTVPESSSPTTSPSLTPTDGKDSPDIDMSMSPTEEPDRDATGSILDSNQNLLLHVFAASVLLCGLFL
jgi:hypothetical protein